MASVINPMTKTVARPLNWFEQVQERIRSLPQPQTEESILFRILVQAMVIVGIVATDVAAQTDWSIWAIPLSLIGSVWSWHRRHQRNIALKFLLAIGMLLVLFFFLSNLVVNLNDSRIALAGLLVQLQVLHSFDLPRRKDLGYSMVIGLILLGVAGTVSQTMIFAFWLLLFLMVALPTLILDYRSRLGLAIFDQNWQWFQKGERVKKVHQHSLRYSPLSFRSLAAIFGITLLLGLTIFALMPRLPSYQLQSFPVSGAGGSEQKQFEDKNRDIVNPGYVNPGKGGKGGTGHSPRTGAGEMDDTFYYGFNSRMNQNLRGQMKKKLVLRVRSQAAGFWQALSFDHYTGQGWEISKSEDLEKINRSPWSYRFNLDYPVGIFKTRSIIQSYTAVTDLPNVIPNLLYPRALYFPTKEIGVDRNGNLRSPVGLQEGLTYTVISEVPYRDRTALRQAPNIYNKAVQERYVTLKMSPKIEDKVRQQAIALLKKSPKPINSAYEATLFLTQAIKQHYTVQTDIPFLAKNEDLVEAFLFKYQGGYPDHFSTVLTVMLRSLGIPARLAVGFAPGQFNPFTGYYLVHNTDAYALTQVLFSHFGWFDFDAIPGHDLYPPSFEDEETFSVLKQLWNWVASWLPSPVTGFLSLFWTNVVETFLKFILWIWTFVSGSILGGLLSLIGVIALGFVSWLGWQQLRRWFYLKRLAKMPPMQRIYQQMLTALKGKGYPKNVAQTPDEYSQSFQGKLTPEQASLVTEISQAYVSWRYGEQPANSDYLHQQLKLLIRSLERQKSAILLTKFKIKK